MPYKPNDYTLHPMAISVLGLTIAYGDDHNAAYDYLVWCSDIREAATASKGLVRLLNGFSN